MNSEAEKNPGGLNIRQELEKLRDEYEQERREASGRVHFSRSAIIESHINDIEALLQRIPDGWEFRPRESSHSMIDASWREAAVASPNAWRAMWDAASEEKGDG